jgi:hypothetical protein
LQQPGRLHLEPPRSFRIEAAFLFLLAQGLPDLAKLLLDREDDRSLSISTTGRPRSSTFDAFAVIRETIREMNKVAIGRVVLTNREHIIALEPMDKGLMGTLLRYPYEVRDPQEYFDDIQDVKITKDMLDLARHIVNQKARHFEPEKFEDQYETALIDLINQKRAGKTSLALPGDLGVPEPGRADHESRGAANRYDEPGRVHEFCRSVGQDARRGQLPL